jgi:hypothetical protein
MNQPLRTIKVTYLGEDGLIFDETTNMAAHLTDAEMLDYFRQGKWFNIGNGTKDYMAMVQKAEIIN